MHLKGASIVGQEDSPTHSAKFFTQCPVEQSKGESLGHPL